MTVAAVDRLVHRSTILELNAESYRRKYARAAARKGLAEEEMQSEGGD